MKTDTKPDEGWKLISDEQTERGGILRMQKPILSRSLRNKKLPHTFHTNMEQNRAFCIPRLGSNAVNGAQVGKLLKPSGCAARFGCLCFCQSDGYPKVYRNPLD